MKPASRFGQASSGEVVSPGVVRPAETGVPAETPLNEAAAAVMQLPVAVGALTHLEQAIAFLQTASYDEGRELLNRAEAIRLYAKRAGLGLEAQNLCAEIRMRSERRLGQLLRSMVRRGPGEYPRSHEQSHQETFGPTLRELGLTKSQSSRWQRMAVLPEALFDSYIEKVKGARHELTSNGLLKLARTVQEHDASTRSTSASGDPTTASSLLDIISSGSKFGCIYADPPWQYANQGTRGATSNHYSTMCLDDIASLPIADLSLPNSHLHLWTTNAFLFEARYIIESWGFEYKSAFIWIKPTIGLGNYWRCAHEYLLLGVRGSTPFRNKSLRSWIKEPRGRHSEKPEVIRSLVEEASPGPYVELFARRQVKGWTSWGDQLTFDNFPPSGGEHVEL